MKWQVWKVKSNNSKQKSNHYKNQLKNQKFNQFKDLLRQDQHNVSSKEEATLDKPDN